MSHAHKMTELAAEDQCAVERLWGRVLLQNEAVEVFAYTVPELARAEDETRSRAVAHMLELAKGKYVGGLSARNLIVL